MTTDNRTNEPSEAQVERLARWYNDHGWMACDGCGIPGVYDECEDCERLCLAAARNALVAAQGAAPQAAAVPETGNELRDEGGDLISSGKHLRILQQGMYVCDTCTNSLGLNVRWDHAIKRDDHAPVQPSGAVGVGKIADEMDRHRHVMVAPGPHQCSCGFVMSEDPGFSGWAREHKLHVARVVVEAIGGESR